MKVSFKTYSAIVGPIFIIILFLSYRSTVSSWEEYLANLNPNPPKIQEATDPYLASSMPLVNTYRYSDFSISPNNFTNGVFDHKMTESLAAQTQSFMFRPFNALTNVNYLLYTEQDNYSTLFFNLSKALIVAFVGLYLILFSFIFLVNSIK